MVRIAWHGSAAHTLDLDGHEVLVDPFFSPAGAYGPWYTANPRAPAADRYLAGFHPELVVITHGHFDHCDLETIKALHAMRPLHYACSPSVAAALRRHCNLDAAAITEVEPGRSYAIGAIRLVVFAGEHWLTGEEGDVAARKLDRPDRYGVFPAGGPSLGFSFGSVYVSGDTTLDGVPDIEAPIAVLSVGTRMRHPVTKEVDTPILTAADVPAAVTRLQARVVAPVHWDFPLFLDPFDLSDLARRLASEAPQCRLASLHYNAWVDLDPA